MTKTLIRPSELDCPPRFGTPRDLTRPTLGSAVAKTAVKLGRPLMPWQRYVVDVANEVDPATGQFAYDEVLLTVPRQSGKTTLILSRATHRCSATTFFGGRQHVVYSAQTRKDARQKFVEEFIPDIEASPTFSTRATPHLGNGDEHIRYKNRSRFGIEATTEKSGHGPVVDEAFIDEAFAQVDNRAEDAVSPAMITRRNSMLWVVSTAGWKDRSPYLLGKVTIGREHVLSGAPGRLCVFEWSALEDADPEDERVWWGCMPALGITVPIDKIRSELEKAQRAGNLNGFRRPYLNQWVLKDAPEDTVIDLEVFGGLVDSGDQRPSPVAFSIEVSEDGKWGTIGLAGGRPDGARFLQVVETRRGSGWIPARVAELKQQWRPVAVALNSSGPAGALLGALAERKVDVVKVAGQELGQACQLFASSVDEGSIRHAGQTQVAVAIGAASKRKTSSSWVWKQNGSTDISPLWALTLALHALDRSNRRSGVVC